MTKKIKITKTTDIKLIKCKQTLLIMTYVLIELVDRI